MHSYLWDAFVSHNRVQKPWVKRMVRQWRNLGLKVFFDEDCIKPGDDIVRCIEQGIKDSRHVVLVISPDAVESDWVALETACGVYSDPSADNRRIIPILVATTPPDTIRPTIQRLRMVDLVDESKRLVEYRYLLESLGVSKRPLPEPPTLESSAIQGENEVPSAIANLDDGDSSAQSGGIAVATGVSTIELVIDRKFDDFSADDRERLLKAIGELLRVKDAITVISQRPGSVKLAIELPSELAEELIQLVEDGRLSEYDVVTAHRIFTTRNVYLQSRGQVDKVFTTGEAAKICKVSQQTIIRCFDNGQLKGFRVPGTRFRRIPREMLYNFMKENGIPTDALELGRRKVLLVDDDDEFLESVTKFLEEDGRFEVRIATTGFDAGMMVKEYLPDIIVLAVMLPDINGKEVCQRVRADNTMEDVRILCISGMLEESEIQDLRLAGADDFLPKPFLPELLIDLICEMLDMSVDRHEDVG